jgi:hypothetical protein
MIKQFLYLEQFIIKSQSTIYIVPNNVKGVYFFGSKVSVCGIPPAIQSKITVSAFEVVFLLLLQEDMKLLTGAPAARAAKVAALVLLKKLPSAPFIHFKNQLYDKR